MICGLTASTTVAQRDATIPLSPPALTPNRCVRSSSLGVSGSDTQIVPGGVPFATSPPMRLVAMLPPPMNPMFASLIPAHQSFASMSTGHYRALMHRRNPRAENRDHFTL